MLSNAVGLSQDISGVGTRALLERALRPLERLDVALVADWRSWLDKHHLAKKEIWLVFHRKGSKVSSITYGEAL